MVTVITPAKSKENAIKLLQPITNILYTILHITNYYNLVSLRYCLPYLPNFFSQRGHLQPEWQ